MFNAILIPGNNVIITVFKMTHYTSVGKIICQPGKKFSQITLDDTIEEDVNMEKFGAVVGNPPYQDSSVGDNTTYQPPVYHQFMDASFKVADKVMLITPARFLFNAGSTPKAWNSKMLNAPAVFLPRFVFPDLKPQISDSAIIT